MPCTGSELDEWVSKPSPHWPRLVAGIHRAAVLLSALAIVASVLPAVGCTGPHQDTGTSVVFKHSKLFGDPQPLDALLDEFTALTGISVARETLPSSSDEQHQFYAINLNAGSSDFDVFALDIIWLAEFAQAGWLRDLTDLVPPEGLSAFFAGPADAVTYRGRVYAMPWFVDAGLLYYRKDLLAKYGFPPPTTWNELVSVARAVVDREPGKLSGFVWQGKQYEGLVCNALEHIWSAGGEVTEGGRVAIGAPESIEAVGLMRDLIARYRVTPAFVTTLTEEPSRVIFGRGRAVFLRSWPYAWSLFQRPGSPVRGKVGVRALPHHAGYSSAGALGGWQLGVNAFSKRPEAAERLVVFLTSREAQKALARAYGYSPPRRDLYSDPDLLAEQPFLGELKAVLEHARPRPVTPRYIAVSQVLQSQFSAAISGAQPVAEALVEAQARAQEILAR